MLAYSKLHCRRGNTMSTGETQRNPSEIVRAAALDYAEPAVTFILPWRMDANQDHLHKGIEQCGCGFCPDEERRTT
jgi:hypothetical protein